METTKQNLRIATVLMLTGLTRPTLYRLMQKGLFPQNFKIGLHCAAWDKDQVQCWMEERRSGKNER
jgi:prophage regulatory protein